MDMIVVGVTGSQDGPTDDQRRVLTHLLYLFGRPESMLHHGGCIGVDEVAHGLGLRFRYAIEVHPPKNKMKAATLDYTPSVRVHPDEDYLVRDDIIAQVCEALIACPARPEQHSPRSGTWATVRYARRAGKYIIIIRPDGTVVCEP